MTQATPTEPSRRISAAWLDSAGLRAVMAALAADGASARFVGGCVRNALLDAGSTDLDIAVDVPPDETIRLLQQAGLRAIPTGVEHGTVTTLAAIGEVQKGAKEGLQETIEITSLRRDVSTDGRRAVVAFTRDWVEDARRRDFTMNALYADADGMVFDPLGSGLADLEARRVRFIGEAEARIQEDYLRILRYFRFLAWYGQGAGEAADLDAIRQFAPRLDRIAAERIGAELKKLLSAPHPATATTLMAELGVLDVVLPEAESAAALAKLETVETDWSLPANWRRRLAALLSANADARSIGGALRLAKAETTALAGRLAALSMAPGEAAYRFGAEAATDAAAINIAADGATIGGDRKRLAAEIRTGAEATLPIKAADLIAAGARPGPSIGAALKAAEADWIRHNFALDRDALLALALKKRLKG